jgi:glutamate racemase
LVDAIEAGDMATSKTLVKAHVAALLKGLPAPQSAVLGCTHYPIVEEFFRAALPTETKLLSQPRIVADATADYLERHERYREAGDTQYFTTGDVGKVGPLAELFLGHPVDWQKV